MRWSRTDKNYIVTPLLTLQQCSANQQVDFIFCPLLHMTYTYNLYLYIVAPFCSRNCNNNASVYDTFHMNNTVSTNVANHRSWADLKDLFSQFSINSPVEVLTPALQSQMQDLSTALMVNLTNYRIALSGFITKRDLNSLVDQLNTVSRKVTDRNTVKRIENLSFKAKQVITQSLKQLEESRDVITYEITALEILLVPLNKQINQTLSHLKTIQYFFNNQGTTIAKKVSTETLMWFSGFRGGRLFYNGCFSSWSAMIHEKGLL